MSGCLWLSINVELNSAPWHSSRSSALLHTQTAPAQSPRKIASEEQWWRILPFQLKLCRLSLRSLHSRLYFQASCMTSFSFSSSFSPIGKDEEEVAFALQHHGILVSETEGHDVQLVEQGWWNVQNFTRHWPHCYFLHYVQTTSGLWTLLLEYPDINPLTDAES